MPRTRSQQDGTNATSPSSPSQLSLHTTPPTHEPTATVSSSGSEASTSTTPTAPTSTDVSPSQRLAAALGLWYRYDTNNTQLHCPACKEMPRSGPVMNCANGHLICPTCHTKIHRCPVCRTTNIKNRNLLAETLLSWRIELNPFQECLHHFRGCLQVLPLQDLLDHEVVCTFRFASGLSSTPLFWSQDRSAEAVLPFVCGLPTPWPHTSSRAKVLAMSRGLSTLDGGRDSMPHYETVLQCPTCYDRPHRGPMMACTNGHLICPQCHPRMTKCRQCNSPDIYIRSLLADAIIEWQLADNEMTECHNTSRGCMEIQHPLQDIVIHQEVCPFRTVFCVACDSLGCSWNGALNDLILHVTHDEPCAILINRCSSSVWYNSYVGTYGFETTNVMSIFRRDCIVSSKPLLFMDNSGNRILGYIQIIRNPNGFWIISAHTHHQDIASKFRFQLMLTVPTIEQIRHAIDPDPSYLTSPAISLDASRRFRAAQAKHHVSFLGDLVLYSRTGELNNHGQTLTLHDDEVLRLRRGHALFQIFANFLVEDVEMTE